MLFARNLKQFSFFRFVCSSMPYYWMSLLIPVHYSRRVLLISLAGQELNLCLLFLDNKPQECCKSHKVICKILWIILNLYRSLFSLFLVTLLIFLWLLYIYFHFNIILLTSLGFLFLIMFINPPIRTTIVDYDPAFFY